MSIDAGSVVVDTDGTVTKSGLAEAIYDSFVDNYAADSGSEMSGKTAAQTHIKHSYAVLATRMAEGIAGYLQQSILTPEQGYTVQLLNKTGAPSVRGSVVQASLAVDSAFVLQTGQQDAIGICYDEGIADGELCRVVIAGVADVLLADGAGANRYDWLGGSPVAGRGYSTGPVPPPVHFYEIGHALQTVAGGTSVLCRTLLHFL